MARYQDAISSIAHDALSGEDVEKRITYLASRFHRDRADVLAEIAERIDLFADA